ncbi:MAG TPA: ComEA family DNA-binding protein [Candidatus Cloacimonadota bacterium]|nr:ComEA family DNA-binding protein [Candidatus Cloacimonadota bacterium]HPT71051.1 ComEA family DNA-binding protein [Candidatus Cloacimonadota bacterium]
MRNYLRDFLTDREQKILLFLCFFLFVGLLVGSSTKKMNTLDPVAAESLKQAIAEPVLLMVDIRTANREELMSLPGIGEKKADDILAYRNEHGFSACNDLLEIKGIGPKTLEKLKPNLVWFGSEIDTLKITHIDKKPVFSGKVNINKASADELMQLPGIGPVKAQAIIDKRTDLKGFTDIEHIMEVKGIGPKTFEKMKDMITTGD